MTNKLVFEAMDIEYGLAYLLHSSTQLLGFADSALVLWNLHSVSRNESSPNSCAI